MTDAAAEARVPAAGSAGALLRQARQAQGLHIAALAAAMKVAPAKLEALETDRFEQLPDATFTRALAQAVCRQLKLDPAAVLALLPPPNGHRLEQVAQGLQTPFRERHGRLSSERAVNLSNVAIWGAVLLLVAAAVVYLVPARVFDFASADRSRAAGDAATAAASEPVPAIADAPAPEAPSTEAASDGKAEPLASTTDGAASAATVAASALSQPAPGAAVQVSAGNSVDSWVEVVDARGQALIFRTLKSGETVAVDGNMPFKVKIGNARTARLTWRGQPVDLKPATNRDDVARLELK